MEPVHLSLVNFFLEPTIIACVFMQFKVKESHGVHFVILSGSDLSLFSTGSHVYCLIDVLHNHLQTLMVEVKSPTNGEETCFKSKPTTPPSGKQCNYVLENYCSFIYLRIMPTI